MSLLMVLVVFAVSSLIVALPGLLMVIFNSVKELEMKNMVKAVVLAVVAAVLMAVMGCGEKRPTTTAQAQMMVMDAGLYRTSVINGIANARKAYYGPSEGLEKFATYQYLKAQENLKDGSPVVMVRWNEDVAKGAQWKPSPTQKMSAADAAQARIAAMVTYAVKVTSSKDKSWYEDFYGVKRGSIDKVLENYPNLYAKYMK